MRAFALAVVLTVFAPYDALAQEVEARSGGAFLPFTFVAAGRTTDETTTLHFGGGLGTVLWKGIGAEAEVGFLGPLSSDAEGFIYGFGVVSLNALYEPLKPGRRITPFVTGGYTVVFTSHSDSAANVGGGINYWMRDGLALRVEFRDHLHTHHTGSSCSYLNFDLWRLGAGITWRR